MLDPYTPQAFLYFKGSMFTLYMHRCKINNKYYIGITSRKPEYRWFNGEGYKGSTYFYNAIQKYGWDNFEHFILLNNLSKKWACVLEQHLIYQYKSNNKQYGYNITSGGENFNHSIETINKIKQSNKGKKRSAETRKQISESHKGLQLRKGTHHSEETKLKISKANTGRRNKPLLLFENNVLIFVAENQYKCAEFLHIKENTVSRALNKYNGRYKNYYMQRL